MKQMTLLIITIVATTLSACSSTKVGNRVDHYEEQRTELVEQTIEDTPDWFLEPPESTGKLLYVTGSGSSTSLTMARNKSILDAQSQLADQVYAMVSSHTKQHLVENSRASSINTDQVIKKIVAEANLSGYIIEEIEVTPEGKQYRAFVMLGYPVGEANQMLIHQQNQKLLRTSHKNSQQRFDELEREIEKQQ